MVHLCEDPFGPPAVHVVDAVLAADYWGRDERLSWQARSVLYSLALCDDYRSVGELPGAVGDWFGTRIGLQQLLDYGYAGLDRHDVIVDHPDLEVLNELSGEQEARRENERRAAALQKKRRARRDEDGRFVASPRLGGPAPRRKSMAPSKVLRVFARDGYACVQCQGKDHLTVDHIKPVVRGGGDEMSNLQTLCRMCNGKKGDS